MNSLILKIGFPLVAFFMFWAMLALGIISVFWMTFLGIILFGWGVVFAVLMHSFIDGRLVEFGAVLIVLGLLLIVLPFAPELFL